MVYGDKLEETAGGDGTGSSADGADAFSFTAGTIAEGASIYGAGGNDTILFSNNSVAASALIVDGGKGADIIGNSASIFFSAAGHGTLAGGNGHDTIKFNQAQSGLTLAVPEQTAFLLRLIPVRFLITVVMVLTPSTC